MFVLIMLAKNKWQVSPTLVSGLNSGIGVILSLAVFCFVVALAVLWIVFPMFVYTGMKRMNRTLDQIDKNTKTK